MIGCRGQRRWDELPALCGRGLVLLGLCRCVWERSSAMEHLWPRTWGSCAVPAPARFWECSLPPHGAWPGIPAAGPDTKLCEELAFSGALLPSSLQVKPETVVNPGEWCRCITKWDYCRLVLCPEALLWTKPTRAKGTAAWQSARKMGIIWSCNWRVGWKLSLLLS